MADAAPVLPQELRPPCPRGCIDVEGCGCEWNQRREAWPNEPAAAREHDSPASATAAREEVMAMKVWIVWSEFGEYEQRSEQTHGAFATRELAEAHAEQVRGQREGWDVRVVEEEVLDELPRVMPYVCFSAHINPDGTEDTGSGYHRDVGRYNTFTNEDVPATGRVARWSHRDGDLYVEVTGYDPEAVAAEYERLLEMARRGETTE